MFLNNKAWIYSCPLSYENNYFDLRYFDKGPKLPNVAELWHMEMTISRKYFLKRFYVYGSYNYCLYCYYSEWPWNETGTRNLHILYSIPFYVYIYFPIPWCRPFYSHLGRIKTPSLFPSSALALGHQALAWGPCLPLPPRDPSMVSYTLNDEAGDWPPPHSQSEGRTRASLSSAYASWAFGELLGLVLLFSRCDCPTSPLCTPPPWSLISLGWDAGAGQVFPQGGRRAGPSAAGLAGSRPAQARSRLCARASYIMETSRSRSGRVTSYLIFWQRKNILTNTAFLHTEG